MILTALQPKDILGKHFTCLTKTNMFFSQFDQESQNFSFLKNWIFCIFNTGGHE